MHGEGEAYETLHNVTPCTGKNIRRVHEIQFLDNSGWRKNNTNFSELKKVLSQTAGTTAMHMRRVPQVRDTNQ